MFHLKKPSSVSDTWMLLDTLKVYQHVRGDERASTRHLILPTGAGAANGESLAINPRRGKSRQARTLVNLRRHNQRYQLDE